MKLITLGKGIYCPKCSVCGTIYQAMNLTRINHKIAPYCFRCESDTIKFTNIMDQELKFTHNWNGKLNCDVFTTIRLFDPQRHVVGATFNIWLKNQPKGKATLIGSTPFLISQLTEYAAQLDTALSKADCQAMIVKMYNNKKIDWSRQQFTLLLLKYNDNKNQPTLQFESKAAHS